MRPPQISKYGDAPVARVLLNVRSHSTASLAASGTWSCTFYSLGLLVPAYLFQCSRIVFSRESRYSKEYSSRMKRSKSSHAVGVGASGSVAFEQTARVESPCTRGSLSILTDLKSVYVVLHAVSVPQSSHILFPATGRRLAVAFRIVDRAAPPTKGSLAGRNPRRYQRRVRLNS